MEMETEKLNNPAWYSLTETHQGFGVDYNGIRFYDPSYCPFGGFTNPKTIQIGIDRYALLTDDFYVIGEEPIFNDTVRLNKELVCLQLILDKPLAIDVSEHIIELQTPQEKRDLFDLVNLVQPGYFKNKTVELGSYFGIYKDEALIAVTGERMKMDGFTEISAVVTHPEHTGKGYAKQLLAHTSNKIFDEDKIPYLHVADTNVGAILLYEKLGFRKRREISFWNFLTGNK